MSGTENFREGLRTAFETFVQAQKKRFDDKETVAVDIHCHDRNSDTPDERLGRILRLPETWSSTESVLNTLEMNDTSPLTLTNHNNARSCWQLMEKGYDILPGAEFTCCMPDFDVSLHVLAYGFTPQDEVRLNELRNNLYRFLEYTVDRDIVTVLAHPLFCYWNNNVSSVRYLEKLTLMFDNFEVINGQRDAWQNLLVASWLDHLTEERIDTISKQENLSPNRFCKRPLKKVMTGGSDCHMALFAGCAHTRFHIPNLAERQRTTPLSTLVLESIKAGRTAPFGRYVSLEKLTCAVLDYFCQVALHMKDPGLVRLLLHKGETNEKLLALGIANGMMELRRHKYTSRFLEAFHKALHGKRPSFIMRRKVSKHYRPLVDELDTVALARQRGAAAFEKTLVSTLPSMFTTLDKLLAIRLQDNVEQHKSLFSKSDDSSFSLLEKLEAPAYLRSLLSGGPATRESKTESYFDLLDGLPFPALLSFVLGGAHFVSAHAMFKNRPLLNAVSNQLGIYTHPKRVLWLTDTFTDKNGVSRTLNLICDQVAQRDLPIDFAVVSNTPIHKSNVVTLPALAKYKLPYYSDQQIAIPDLLELHKTFIEGGYDRIICSTEGPMAAISIYLKYAFSVPAYFYLHTDWLAFAEKTLRLDKQNMDRARRSLRALYRCFDGFFVLNSDQHAGVIRDFSISEENVYRTDHWTKDSLQPKPIAREQLLGDAAPQGPLLVFAARVSYEKGIEDLPKVMAQVQRSVPNARLLVLGDGPALDALKKMVPDGIFLGWVGDDTLAKAYTLGDVMIFPSRFDTFGNVLVEANACGLPTVAYAEKGPKDIVSHGKNGFLADTPEEMAHFAIKILQDANLKAHLSRGALECAASHQPGPIMNDLLANIGLHVCDEQPTVHPDAEIKVG